MSDQLELEDKLTKKLDQLTALLASVTGTGFAGFSELSEGSQENLLWLAYDLSIQSNNVWKKLKSYK